MKMHYSNSSIIMLALPCLILMPHSTLHAHLMPITIMPAQPWLALMQLVLLLWHPCLMPTLLVIIVWYWCCWSSCLLDDNVSWSSWLHVHARCQCSWVTLPVHPSSMLMPMIFNWSFVPSLLIAGWSGHFQLCRSKIRHNFPGWSFWNN